MLYIVIIIYHEERNLGKMISGFYFLWLLTKDSEIKQFYLTISINISYRGA